MIYFSHLYLPAREIEELVRYLRTKNECTLRKNTGLAVKIAAIYRRISKVARTARAFSVLHQMAVVNFISENGEARL